MRNLTMPFATIGRAGAIVAIAVAVFAGGLGLGAGLSTISAQSGGEIHGCVNRFTGALRIVNGTGQCTSSERSLSWSQQGAGGMLDVQVVSERTTVVTDDRRGKVDLVAGCPAGYKAAGGGGGLTTQSGSDIWATSGSLPTIDDAGDPTGWRIILKTTNGQDADGIYGFSVYAVCALTS